MSRISSIRFSFGGVQIDWMMKQSPPRTFSRISIITSPSGKRPTSASPIFTPRCSVTSRASAGLEFPVKTSSWSLTLSDIFNFLASRSSCDSSVAANHRRAWLGGKDSNLRMPGPKPGALPAWRPPSAFGFKGSAPALLPIDIVKTDSRRNTTWALSRRIEQTNLYGPTVAILCTIVAANLPGLSTLAACVQEMRCY